MALDALDALQALFAPFARVAFRAYFPPKALLATFAGRPLFAGDALLTAFAALARVALRPAFALDAVWPAFTLRPHRLPRLPVQARKHRAALFRVGRVRDQIQGIGLQHTRQG
jgi:hypothetical protein